MAQKDRNSVMRTEIQRGLGKQVEIAISRETGLRDRVIQVEKIGHQGTNCQNNNGNIDTPSETRKCYKC